LYLWEAIALAVKTKQNLAILLLDFEKAYDRVDWEFLQGTLLQFGFASTEVHSVATSSEVLIAGDLGQSF
jgi:hypothetical protein